MADFEIDVGFNTEDLNDVFSGSTPSVSNLSGTSMLQPINSTDLIEQEELLSSGVSKGLKATGIVAILSQLSIVTETISFLLAIISTGIGFLVSSFAQFIVPFFQDPSRALIELSISTANLIIQGLEFGFNSLLGVISGGAVGGFEENFVEFPRLRPEIILEAYDSLQETLEAGSQATAQEIATAQKQFEDSYKNAFLTQAEYDEVKNIAEDSKVGLIEASESVSSSAEEYIGVIESGFNTVKDSATSVFEKIEEVFTFIENKARGVLDQKRISSDTIQTIPQQTFPTIANQSTLFSNIGGGFQTSDIQAEYIRQNYNKQLRFNK